MHKRHLAALAIAGATLLWPASALAAAPTVVTGKADGVTYNAATLTGTINPRGSETDYYFQYGTKSLSSKTPLTPVGNGTKSVAAKASIAGLTPDTTYRYRLVGVGATTVDGATKTFKTTTVPLSLSISASPNPVQFGSSFVLSGTLSGTGNGNRQVVLQATPFPYTAPFVNEGNAEVTNADGTFSFPFPGLLQTAKLRVATVTKPVVTSAEVIEGVAVNVSLHVKHTSRRNRVRLTGTVTPPEVGAQVVFQRVTSSGPVTVGTTSVKGGTTTTATFSGLVRKRKHSLYRAQIIFPAGLFSPSVSNPVLVR